MGIAQPSTQRTPASADSSAKRDLALTGGPPGEADGQRTAGNGGNGETAQQFNAEDEEIAEGD
jgi:hypothetical protein